ncbi:hypothetical protein BKA83DRAFT_4046649 [Pisolithus microcarpus]|nr:hypothetical protein BKA83DRAFT_4046649 [Pisolithus microcarpus]
MCQTIPRSPSARRAVNASRIPCLHAGCHRWFKTASGLNHHKLSFHNYSFHKSGLPVHSQSTSPHEGVVRDYHDKLTGTLVDSTYLPISLDCCTGQKCDSNGQPIQPNSPPPPVSEKDPDDWGPYGNQLRFETAEFIFQEAEMSASKIDKLLYLWGGSSNGGRPPFSDHNELYETIDATKLGDVRWDTFRLRYNGERPTDNVPPWMDEVYEYWFRDPSTLVENMFSNMEFDGEIDYAPYQDFTVGDKRRYQNFMSGDWAWSQADNIARDPSTHGSTFIPVILGSDKTTVSVATGQNDYWPVYLSIGNIHNNVRRAHRNGVELLAFLAIPKAAKKYTDDPTFRRFKKQLFHAAMSRILSPLKSGMTIPRVMKCPDGHFRRAIFGIGPYIADYPEQVLVSGIVQNWCGRCVASPDNLDAGGPPRTAQLMRALIEELQAGTAWDEWGVDVNVVPFTEDFPRADICQLLAPDILHQLVKGGFKDHLVEWVGKYLELKYGKAGAKERMMDIDRRIAAAPPFPGLRRFPDGRGFSQWTGDDSKALMKYPLVYLPAIEGHIPQDIVRTLHAFLEFCYIVRQNVITDDTLSDLKNALDRFHYHREIFRDVGVQVEGFSLPRQHSLVHYEALICLFGAPNGLCTSITESKHITAVKKPWWRSSKYRALGQILRTNQRLAQLAAARSDFEARGMLPISRPRENVLQGPQSNGTSQHFDDMEDEHEHAGVCCLPILSQILIFHEARGRARSVPALAIELGIPTLSTLIGQFLYEQLQCESISPSAGAPRLPVFAGALKVFHSATATFVSPSDPSGIGGMRREKIRAIPVWHHGPARYDTIFVSTDDTFNGMLSMEVTRMLCFFSFVYTNGYSYSCALIHWFDRIADEPDDLTGMWMVRPSFMADGSKNLSVIHVDSIVRGAHLLPIFGREQVPRSVDFHNSLDIYRGFYVNRFADYHAFELAS